MSYIERIVGWLGSALELFAQVLLALMMVTICYDVLMRYIFTAPTSWALEVNSFLIVAITLLPAAALARRGEHLNITFFQQMLGARSLRTTQVLIALLGVVFSAILAWRGLEMTMDAYAYNERMSTSLGTPMVYPYALLPIGFGLLCIQYFINGVNFALGRETSAHAAVGDAAPGRRAGDPGVDADDADKGP